MLLPAMIMVGSRILGWEIIDMDVVLHVRAVWARLWLAASTLQINCVCFAASQPATPFSLTPLFAAIQDAKSRGFRQVPTRDHHHGGKDTF